MCTAFLWSFFETSNCRLQSFPDWIPEPDRGIFLCVDSCSIFCSGWTQILSHGKGRWCHRGVLTWMAGTQPSDTGHGGEVHSALQIQEMETPFLMTSSSAAAHTFSRFFPIFHKVEQITRCAWHCPELPITALCICLWFVYTQGYCVQDQGGGGVVWGRVLVAISGALDQTLLR